METMTRSAPSTAAAFDLDNLIREAKFGNAPARLWRARGRHDRACRALGAGCPRDRGADKAGANQSQTIEQGLRFVHARFPTNSLSACTTRPFASSVPTLIRKAFGNL